jgi:hypothetical protein
VVGALDAGLHAEYGAEQTEFLAAQTLARFGGDADRAVIFAQEQRAIRACDTLAM